VRLPDERLGLPADLTEAADVLGDRFPHERTGIARVFLAMEQMVADLDKVVPSFRVADRPGRGKSVDRLLMQFQRPWLSDLMNPVASRLRMPGHTLLKYQNLTQSDLLDEHLTDPMAKAYVAQLAVGIGTPPGQLSAAIAGVPHLPTTPSFFQVQLGVDLDLTPYRDEIKRLNFRYEDHDLDTALSRFPSGDVERAAFYVYVATFHQPDLAPPGMASIKLECPTTLVSDDLDWERDKEWIADTFIRRAERVIPGLRDHIVVRRVRTPLDMVRGTGNSDGAFAGWALVPQMLSRQRPAADGRTRPVRRGAVDHTERRAAMGHGVRVQHRRHGAPRRPRAGRVARVCGSGASSGVGGRRGPGSGGRRLT
jgi:hypothetical protein